MGSCHILFDMCEKGKKKATAQEKTVTTKINQSKEYKICLKRPEDAQKQMNYNAIEKKVNI